MAASAFFTTSSFIRRAHTASTAHSLARRDERTSRGARARRATTRRANAKQLVRCHRPYGGDTASLPSTQEDHCRQARKTTRLCCPVRENRVGLSDRMSAKLLLHGAAGACAPAAVEPRLPPAESWLCGYGWPNVISLCCQRANREACSRGARAPLSGVPQPGGLHVGCWGTCGCSSLLLPDGRPRFRCDDPSSSTLSRV